MSKYAQITDMIGKNLVEVKHENDVVTFLCDDGTKFSMYHEQDCCESVNLEKESIHELENLKGKVIYAYETSNSGEIQYGTYTWTFYNIQTENGFATLRWYGESNGYYSESVSFSVTGPEIPKVETVIKDNETIKELRALLLKVNNDLAIVVASERKLVQKNAELESKLNQIKSILEAK